MSVDEMIKSTTAFSGTPKKVDETVIVRRPLKLPVEPAKPPQRSGPPEGFISLSQVKWPTAEKNQAPRPMPEPEPAPVPVQEVKRTPVVIPPLALPTNPI